MIGEEVDVEESDDTDDQHAHEHETDEKEHEDEGECAPGEQDRSQNLVVDDVERVIEGSERAVDEVRFVVWGGARLAHTTNIVVRKAQALIQQAAMILGPPWVPTTGPTSETTRLCSLDIVATIATN